MASDSIPTACHLSDHSRRKLRDNLESEAGISLPLGLRHEPNHTISMTSQQRKRLEDARSTAGRVTVIISFSQEQLKSVTKIDKSVVHKNSVETNKLDSLSMKELAELYDQVCAAMRRKVEAETERFKAAPSTTKRGPLITPVDMPCDISYNESLYCGACKKKTDNEAARLVEHGARHKVVATCSCCKKEKSREVMMDKEVEEGRVSFL